MADENKTVIVEINKTVIKVDRKLEPFKCRICKRMVRVNNARPKITQTDSATLYGWDYGHSHKNAFHIQRVENVATFLPINDVDED